MDYGDTAIQIVIAIIILTGILIKLLASIVIGLYRDLTVGCKKSELTFWRKLFYAAVSVGGLVILLMASVAILSGGIILTAIEFIFAIIIGILIFQ